MLFWIGLQYPANYSEPREESYYETDFWDLSNAITDPLDIENVSEYTHVTTTEEGTFSVDYWGFNYYSETYKENEIRINSLLVRPTSFDNITTAILVLHGYGSSIEGFADVIENLAIGGYIVLAIDAPGSGQSSSYLPLNPSTFFDISDGPTSAHLYHSIWAAARALTFLESLSYIENTIVLGGSMGGMETFILSAIDNRVDGSIPMISSGCLEETLLAGSLMNGYVKHDYGVYSEELDNIIKWFDPIAYAQQLTEPVLMFFGTNDPFFVLDGMIETSEVITAPLTLSIHPNSGHFIEPSWVEVVIRWLDAHFKNEVTYPSIEVKHEEIITLKGWTISISATASAGSNLILHYRTGDPGSPWDEVEMVEKDGVYTYELTPYHIGRVTFFVSQEDGDLVFVSSLIQDANAGSFLVPLITILSGICLLFIIRWIRWRPSRVRVLRETPMFVGYSMIGLGFILPFTGVSNRVEIDFLQFLEVYGNTLGLSGWFLSLMLLFVCFIISLSSIRYQLPLKLTILLWMPVLAIMIISYSFLAIMFAVSGGLANMYLGTGALLMIFSVPVMLSFESVARRRVFTTQNVLPVQENPSA